MFWRFWRFVVAGTVESISAIFSPIGAILRELQPFLCFWGFGDRLESISALCSLFGVILEELGLLFSFGGSCVVS